VKQAGPSIRASIPTLFRHAATIWAIVAIVSFAAAQEKQLAIYAPQTQYRVSVIDRPTGAYVGLLDVLEPLGKIESHADGKKWKVRYTPAKTALEVEFEAGKRTGKVRGVQFDLGGEFFLQGDRGYVPMESLPNLLPRLLERTADLHATGRRLFLGGAGMKYTLEIRHNPTRLVVTFPSAVAPTIVPNGNRIRLVFNRDPIISSGANAVSYNDPPIVSADFIESNGNAILEIVGLDPMQAVLSDGGKVVTVTASTQTVSQAAVAQTPTAETPLPPPVIPPAAPTSTATIARRSTLVVIDAAHGGDERGAQLTDKLNEKDVTLALARRIQHELENRGFSVLLLRSGDTTLTADQRASTANTARAGVYLDIHAATLGTGVRIYTAMLPAAPAAIRRTFLPWESAQAPFLEQSSAAATAIAAEFTNRKIPVRSLAAPLRPLNNIAGTAVAIEIAPEGDSVESINDAKYQQNVAAAVAAGIAASRGKLESQ
jgi:N-acetylmuramoyl-L-alanine amidase